MGSLTAFRFAMVALALGLSGAAARPAPAQPAASGPPPGDAMRGRSVYGRRCSGCHAMVLNRSGPRHLRVFGQRAGSVADYEYSDALRNSGVIWNERTLDRWLADPEGFIPGNSMGYQVRSARDRADIIAYLKSMPRARPR